MESDAMAKAMLDLNRLRNLTETVRQDSLLSPVLERSQSPLADKPQSPTLVQLGFNPEKYAVPRPADHAIIAKQQAAIIENNDERLADMIKDLGGVLVCAKLYASQLIAMMDMTNSAR